MPIPGSVTPTCPFARSRVADRRRRGPVGSGAMSREHAGRLWHLFPVAVQALVDAGPDLVDTFVPRAALRERAATYAPHRTDWLACLDEAVDRGPTASPGARSSQQSDLFEQYTRVLQAVAQRGPLLLVLDDLQWADLGSISLLFHLGRRLAGSRTLIVGVYRSEEVALGRDGARHPLEPVVNEFQRDHGEIIVNLDQARAGLLDALLDSEPNRLGGAFREMLYRQTSGHPLSRSSCCAACRSGGIWRKIRRAGGLRDPP